MGAWVPWDILQDGEVSPNPAEKHAVGPSAKKAFTLSQDSA